MGSKTCGINPVNNNVDIILQCHSVQVTSYGLVNQNVICIKNKVGTGGEADISQRVHGKDKEEWPKDGPQWDTRRNTYCL